MSSPWTGIHHVALVTPDLDATIDYYVNILEMEVSDVYPAAGRRGRHCFIRPGETLSWGLHFFEYSDAVIARSDHAIEALSTDRHSAVLYQFVPGALQHIAFQLRSEEEAMKLRERLGRNKVPMTDIYDQGVICNFVFVDNSGIQLEAAWPQDA